MNAQHLISELEFEFISTEKLLKLIPAEKLSWKPHQKARSLGELALHVAIIPGRNLQFAKDVNTTVEALTARKLDTTNMEIMDTFYKSKEKVFELLRNDFDKISGNTWNLTKDSKAIFSLPVAVFTRLIVLNHFIHHRGELVMYLRTLDIKIPSVYGPSADENPFG